MAVSEWVSESVSQWVRDSCVDDNWSAIWSTVFKLGTLDQDTKTKNCIDFQISWVIFWGQRSMSSIFLVCKITFEHISGFSPELDWTYEVPQCLRLVWKSDQLAHFWPVGDLWLFLYLLLSCWISRTISAGPFKLGQIIKYAPKEIPVR